MSWASRSRSATPRTRGPTTCTCGAGSPGTCAAPRGCEQAIAYFEQAIAEDAGYALAWSGLADAYAIGVDYRNGPVAEGFEKAKELARRAIALDDGLAEAHTSLAWVTFIHDWDWAAAEREFRRAIDANPNYASAHQWYAWLLASQGRLIEGLRAGERAVELDPTSVSVQRGLGSLHFYARDIPQAIEHMRRALAMNPTSLESMVVLGMALNQAGRLAEAEATLRDGLIVAAGGHGAAGGAGPRPWYCRGVAPRPRQSGSGSAR